MPVPPDALVLLVGPAGAGKSTFAGRCFPAGSVLSSDAFRRLVADDEADQGATADAFRLLHAASDARLRRGLLTVVDATNLLASARAPLLACAARRMRPVVAVIMDTPLETCLVRNGSRPGRTVPEGVVRHQHALLRRALPRLAGEGYAAIIRVVPDGQPPGCS